eukprot:UN25199
MLLPDSDAMVMCVLHGITLDRGEHKTAATNAIRALVTQREVHFEIVEVERCDVRCHIFVGPDRENLSLKILKNGWGKIRNIRARNPPNPPEFFTAEAEAKENKAGVWVNYKPPPERKPFEENNEDNPVGEDGQGGD